MKALIVENDKYARRLLAIILENQEIEVIEARNGEEAITLAERHQPDLVLMDVIMPKLDGFGALEKLKANKHTAHIRVVLMSAVTQAEYIKRGMELGAEDFLEKPFDMPALERKIEWWAEGR